MVVVVEDATIEISYIEILPTVIVVVSNGNAEAPAAMIQIRLRADVGKCAVMFVAIELAGMALASVQVLKG